MLLTMCARISEAQLIEHNAFKYTKLLEEALQTSSINVATIEIVHCHDKLGNGADAIIGHVHSITGCDTVSSLYVTGENCLDCMATKARCDLGHQGMVRRANRSDRGCHMHHHVLRASFQGGHVWGNAFVPRPAIPDPSQWG